MADPSSTLLIQLLIFCLHPLLSQAQEFCRSLNYWCKEGHCCGHGRCCTYYYELWYFWLVWLAIALAGFCCFYQKKLWKNRNDLSRQLHGNVNDAVVTSSVVVQADPSQPLQPPASPPGQAVSTDPDKVFKLPSYEEAQVLPKDPPPYGQVYQALSSLASSTPSAGQADSVPPPIPCAVAITPDSLPPSYRGSTEQLPTSNHRPAKPQESTAAEVSHPSRCLAGAEGGYENSVVTVEGDLDPPPYTSRQGTPERSSRSGSPPQEGATGSSAHCSHQEAAPVLKLDESATAKLLENEEMSDINHATSNPSV